jgi:hypothetical protein
MRRRALLLAVLLAMGGAAFGHNLIAESSAPSSWANPFAIADPQVSQVYYCRLETGRRQLWFSFKGKAGQKIWFQSGVPVIERLSGLRPQVAIVGPGLPAIESGFELPPGLGAVVFSPSEEPRTFHEGVTGTDSWIIIEQEYVLPATGTWYLVAYADQAVSEADKLWLAIGTKERFGLKDLFRLGAIKRFVRAFHEVT